MKTKYDMRETEDAKASQPDTHSFAEHAFSEGMPSSIPTRLGRYHVERELGRGGFGQVYRAWDTELQRHVAIKLSSKVLEAESTETYSREARIVASLDHPHIVPVYDVGRSEDGKCFVVSKLIEGSNLEQRLKSHRLSHREAVEMIATIAEAVQVAHEQDLVHRDIKPANILIDTQGRPYLCDFGLALRQAEYGTGPVKAGTPLWMSPEQARGEGHRVDGRSDVFALGGVLYWLLTGRPPFSGEDVNEVLGRITSEDACPLRQRDASIPVELERICLKALARQKSDRFGSAQELADELRTHLARADSVQSKLIALESQNKLLQIEQQWQVEREGYKSSLGVPALYHGILGTIGGGWIALWGVGASYIGLYVIGVPMILMGIAFPLYLFRKYSKYQQAYRRYQQRREVVKLKPAVAAQKVSDPSC